MDLSIGAKKVARLKRRGEGGGRLRCRMFILEEAQDVLLSSYLAPNPPPLPILFLVVCPSSFCLSQAFFSLCSRLSLPMQAEGGGGVQNETKAWPSSNIKPCMVIGMAVQ